MLITATLSVDDYIAAHRLLRRKRRPIAYVVGGLVAAIGLVIALAGVQALGAVVMFAGIGALLGHAWHDRRYVLRNARQLYGETLAFSRPFTFTWDAEAIQGLGANSVGRCRWDELVRYEECEKVMVLFVDEDAWQVYAKKWFTDAAALEDFRAHASRAGRAALP